MSSARTKTWLLFLLPILSVYLIVALYFYRYCLHKNVELITQQEISSLNTQKVILREKIFSCVYHISSALSHLPHHQSELATKQQVFNLLSQNYPNAVAIPSQICQIWLVNKSGRQKLWSKNSFATSKRLPKLLFQPETTKALLDINFDELPPDTLLLFAIDATSGQAGDGYQVKPVMNYVTSAKVIGENNGVLLFTLRDNYLFRWANLEQHKDTVTVEKDAGLWTKKLELDAEWDYIAHIPKEKNKLISTDSKILIRDVFGYEDKIIELNYPIKISTHNFALHIKSTHFGEKLEEATKNIRQEHIFHNIFPFILIILGSFLCSDIYNKKQETFKQLQKTKDLLEKIFNNSLPMCITSPDYKIAKKNKEYDLCFPAKSSSSLALKCYESRPGPDCHTENCSLTKTLKHKGCYHNEIEKQCPDGTTKHYIYRGQFLKDCQGKPIGVLQSFQDITERVKIEQDLHDAVERIDLLQRILPICAYCRKIRDGQGSWQQVEEYFSNNSDLDFSHGICPKCLREHFPDSKIES